MSHDIARRAVLTGGLGTLVTAVCGRPAQAASVVIMANHIRSVANISISITTPSVTLRTIAPGYYKSGYGFYASASKLTMYWLGNGPAKVAKAGAWTWLGASTSTWTIRVYP